MIEVATLTLKAFIVLTMISIFYSPESADIEQSVTDTVGVWIKRFLFLGGFGYLIINIWQIFGIEMTIYTKLIKQICVFSIMISVFIYVKKFKS